MLINNILYIEKGSKQDNGTAANLYYKKDVVLEHDIVYNSQKSKLKITTTVYVDDKTDLIIGKEYFSYIIKSTSFTYANVCASADDENKILALIPDPIDKLNESANNGNIDISGNSSSNILSNNSASETGNNEYYENSYNEDDNIRKDAINEIKGLFDNSMGKQSDDNVRRNLPLGSNILNPDIYGQDYTALQGPIPRENNLANKGVTYPVIRINDHYFQDTEIIHFSIETGYYKDYTDYEKYKMPVKGFIPTMRLIVNTSNQGLLKRNHIKQGDKCSVFFSANHSMVKSMRCDFRITNVVSSNMDQNHVDRFVTEIIYGELYVPDLKNENLRYNFNGSSRDAIMDAAKKLRLSFFFCDPDDNDDIMVWCNCKNMETFIKEVTTHSWKSPDAFFESWIDPRYGLSFQNINRLLGEDGLDEPLDVTFWINTFINNRAIDGNAAEKTPEEKIKTDKPQAKILTNIPSDDESTTVYHVNKWRIINNAQEIQDNIGLNCKMQYESVNPGMDGNSKYSVEFSLCLNKTKFDPERDDNDFYVLLGPGRNMTYESGDSAMGVSETQSSNKTEPEKVVNQQSDGDAHNIVTTGGNMMSSGNTHRFYEVAYEHNMRNLLLLQKQYLEVELNGANLTIVRGEKIPLMLMDLNKVDLAMRTSLARTQVEEAIYESESGWYIIDGIEWVFDPANGSETGTAWRTNVKLTRREWPVPGKDKTVNDDLASTSKQPVLVDIGNSQYVKLAYSDALSQYGKDAILGVMLDEVTVMSTLDFAKRNKKEDNSDEETGTLYTENGSETVSAVNFNYDMIDLYVMDEDKVSTSNIPLTGLKSYMKDLYHAISNATDNKIKLVSARRWAVDQYGNKLDGNAFIKKYGYYKCINAIGEVMYFKKNNSRHLYGEAFDIINDGIDFTDLMTKVIMVNPLILRIMYEHGVSVYIEQSKDDTGITSKHYHIGTDTIKQALFWASVKAVLGNDKIPGTIITFTNYAKNNVTTENEITYAEIDEISLK